MDPNNPGRVIGRTEVERRENYMRELNHQFSRSHPILVNLVVECLNNDFQKRLSSEILLVWLQERKTEIEEQHGVHVGKMLNIASILVAKELKTKDKRIKELQVSSISHVL